MESPSHGGGDGRGSGSAGDRTGAIGNVAGKIALYKQPLPGPCNETSLPALRNSLWGGEPMKTFVRMLVLCLVVPAGVALTQDKPAQEKPAVTPENPLST